MRRGDGAASNATASNGMASTAAESNGVASGHAPGPVSADPRRPTVEVDDEPGASLAALRAVVEGWHLAVHGDDVAEALALVDRLTAKIHADVAALDEARLWEHDGATSMTAWMRTHGGCTRSDAARTVGIARRLARWPATAAAWEAGDLSGGQVQAISANVGHHHIDRYAEQEDELVPVLAPLSVADTGRAMGGWRARADASCGDAGGQDEPRRHLHLSPMLDGRHRLDGELDAEGAAIVAHAISWADRPPIDGDPPRRPAQRRADALVEVCRRALAEQRALPGRRQRPHINLTVDLLALGAAGRGTSEHRVGAGLAGGTGPAGRSGGLGLGRLDDGTSLNQAATQRLLCDAGLHRFVTAGRSIILDYGTTTRTVPPGLFQALVVRDGGCRWPGCDRPHAWCEAHHVVPWLAGGSTSPSNLVLLCSRHHHLAHGQHGHRRGWQVSLVDDGSFVVTSPEGRVTRSRPPP